MMIVGSQQIHNKEAKNLDRMRMAERLRTARRKRKETQEVVASAVGITCSAYAMYETGERVPRDDVKVKIAEHFETTVSALFF